MPADAGDCDDGIRAQVAARWQAADPLLPAPGTTPVGCGTTLTVTGADGHATASGVCRHWEGEPDSLDLAWGAARRFRLIARVAGPDVPLALSQLLACWRGHLAEVPGTDDDDSAAVMNWPSRDIDGTATLLRHGFSPLAVIAARAAGHSPTQPAGEPAAAAAGGEHTIVTPPGTRIRRALPADVDAVTRLGLEVIRYDQHFGAVMERPGTAAALRRQTATLLAEPEPWTWLAERDGTAVGMLSAERPGAATWIAPLVRGDPVSYLGLLSVLPSQRGHGIGAALTRQFHRESAAAGVAVTLLHHATLNPLSAPFWSRRGYRPLWTTWEARPAGSIR